MKTIIAVVLAVATGALVAGCAGNGATQSASSAGTSSGSGVTVFGTIDASVTHSTTKSGPAR